MGNVKVYEKEINSSNVEQKAIIFKDLLNNNVAPELTPYSTLPYENSFGDENLLLKFFKKVTLHVSNSEQESNSVSIYLRNPKDCLPHYNMTQEIYNNNRDILDQMEIVIFIREPNEDSSYYDDYDPNEDMRLQHLLAYVQYKRQHPEEQGNQ